MGSINSNFNIEADGTINRRPESSENASSEKMYLNIIRVASQNDNILSAYRARKKCYKLCKKSGRPDYKEHIQQLQLDYYPDEFKKSLLGARYVLNLWMIIGCAVLLIFSLIGLYASIDSIRADIHNGWHYGDDLWGLFFSLLFSISLVVIVKRFLIKKALNLKQEIRSLSK